MEVTITINGKQVSRDTPLRNYSLPSGSHRFTFKNPAESFTLEKAISVPANRKTSIYVDVEVMLVGTGAERSSVLTRA